MFAIQWRQVSTLARGVCKQMKWFIFVIMVGMYGDGSQDTYLYTEPTLPTLEECQAYVYMNSLEIRKDMMFEFDGKMIEKVFCIEEEKLKKFLALQNGGIET